VPISRLVRVFGGVGSADQGGDGLAYDMCLERTDRIQHSGQGMGVVFYCWIFPHEPAGGAVSRHIPGDNPEIVGQGAELESPGLGRPSQPM
jgi:hypothetical protein